MVETTVSGRERFGTASAPTCNGLFDPEPVDAQLADAIATFEGLDGHWVDDDDHAAKA